MALKTKNTNKTRIPVSPSNLSNDLVTVLDHLAVALNSAPMSNDAEMAIFAAARQIRVTARNANILSRFDRQVNQSEFAGVFNDHDYCWGKFAEGVVDPVRDPAAA